MNDIIVALRDFLASKQARVVLASSAALALAWTAWGVYEKRKRAERRAKYPKDVVVLHQFPRGMRAPHVSPFALKLETWLRMANIK